MVTLRALICGMSILGCAEAGVSEQPIEGIGPLGEVKKVAHGFAFLEGPTWRTSGELFFTDIPSHRILRIKPGAVATVLTDDSRHANGLMLNPSGELVACEMDGQVAAWNLETGERRLLAATYEGARFNAPNDLAIDASGGVYFTDPRFRAPQPLPQGVQAVYYISPDSSVRRVTGDLPAPNGVVLSTDERKLYVFPSDDDKMRVYEVTAPGVLGPEKTFCKLRSDHGRGIRGADGGAIDVQGNVYITTPLGVQVVSPEGRILGVIRVPETPANCAFGGADLQTLYITAQESLYSVVMPVAGLPRQKDE